MEVDTSIEHLVFSDPGAVFGSGVDESKIPFAPIRPDRVYGQSTMASTSGIDGKQPSPALCCYSLTMPCDDNNDEDDEYTNLCNLRFVLLSIHIFFTLLLPSLSHYTSL